MRKFKLKGFPLILTTFSLLFFFFLFSYRLLSCTSTVSLALNQAIQHNSIYAAQERHQLVDQRHVITAVQPDAILLPDWEVLLLIPNQSLHAHARARAQMMCQFQNGATSSAFFGGVIPSSGRAAFRCVLSDSMRRIRPFFSPRLISASISSGSLSNSSDVSKFGSNSTPEIIRWNQLVYDAITTDLDVILFVKGLNKRSGATLPLTDVQCVYLSVTDSRVATYAATSAAQEVFCCPYPSSMDFNFSNTSSIVRVSLTIGGNKTPLPSLATYSAPRVPAPRTKRTNQSLVCACTMVCNVAKFLREWVLYHAAIGVEKFILYDNASNDELGPTVSQLLDEGYDVATYYWPWPKTQEAGFSHCAAVNEQICQWMAFIDVDEFIFSPAWASKNQPDPSMLASLVQPVGRNVGQISIGCHEFGPSGLRAHPKAGVIQGYTCRRKLEERHKSIVWLRAVHHSLVNSVHHFRLKDGFITTKLGPVHINHYKYQAWEEFRMKFRRRVSAYVVDWKDKLNPDSKDRTPGLGFEPVEPDGWAYKFCEQNDTLLRDVTRRWFARKEADGTYTLKWQRT